MAQERHDLESDVVLPSQAWLEDPFSSVRLPSYKFYESDLLDFVPGTLLADFATLGVSAASIASIEHETMQPDLYVSDSDRECAETEKNLQERTAPPEN